MFGKQKNNMQMAVLAEMLAMPWMISEMHMQSVIAGLMAAPQSKSPFNGSGEMQVAGGLAIIRVFGPIIPSENWYSRNGYATACTSLVDQLNQAMSDSQVERVKFEFNTPGGIALGLEEATRVMYRHRGTKPMLAHVVGSCFSAGYYLAAPCDRIVANPSTSTGSVGSVWWHQDVSSMFEQYGIKITAIQHGKHKTDGSAYRPLDEQGRETMQEWVSSYGQQFEEAVALYRGLTVEQVRSDYGQGKFYIAHRAQKVGLIDAVTDPQMSTDELFQGIEMSTTDTKTPESKTETETKTDATPANETTDLEKLTSAVTGLTGAVESQGKRLDGLEASNKPGDGDGGEGKETPTSETNESSAFGAAIEGIEDSIARLEAKVDHKSGSSPDAADGTDGTDSKASCVYKIRGSRN